MKNSRTFFVSTIAVIVCLNIYIVIKHETQVPVNTKIAHLKGASHISNRSSNSFVANSRKLDRNISMFLSKGQPDGMEVLSRKKRYILFPDGSTFTAAVCSTQTVIGSDTGTAEYTESFVWALVYDLPSTLEEFGFMKQRKRRDVHRVMASLLDRANIKGEDCVLKSVCEIKDALRPKLGIAEEILRILFTNPEEDESEETSGLEENTLNTRTLEQMSEEYEDCDVQYPACPVSLLHMLLGLQVESVELRR